MTLHALAVPKWGLTMEEGTLAEWLVQEGDPVARGQPVAEIETSKTANVLEAPVAGVLRRQLAARGVVKAVGELLGVLADGDEDDAAIDAFVARFEKEAAVSADATTAEAVRAVTRTHRVDGLAMQSSTLAAMRGEQGTPLLLLHGFGGNHLNWMLNQPELAGDRDVHALDLAGHGGSAKDVGDGSLETLAAGIARWMQAVGLETAHVIGHSMGAAVGAVLALSHSSRVTSLTAIGGAGFGGVLDPAYVQGFVAAGRRKELQPVVERLFARPALATRQMLDDLLTYKRTDGVAAALRALGEHALSAPVLDALRARLSGLQVPLLRIHGAEDRVVTGAAESDLPGQWLRIEDAGHMPHLENAAPVNAGIAAFVRQHDAAYMGNGSAPRATGRG